MGGITQDCMQHEIQCTVPVSAVAVVGEGDVLRSGEFFFQLV